MLSGCWIEGRRFVLVIREEGFGPSLNLAIGHITLFTGQKISFLLSL